MINPVADERLGYPTQKPLELVDRIIKASCPEDGVVFDPFCGCGTTIEAAVLNQRQWIKIDIAIHSIHLIEDRRIKKYPDIQYKIEGIPMSEEQAKYLDAAGFFEYKDIKHDKIQLLTIEQVFQERFRHCPSAVKTKRKEGGQQYFAY